jgi:hypothetical protein
MNRTLMKTALLAVLGVSARPLVAQDSERRQKRESEDVYLRNDCRLAVQVLTRGQPADKREWALGTISRCDESGPPVLARMWREVAADSASLSYAIYRSVSMRDRRVYGVVSAVARDRTLPALKRAAALHLLGRWARPGLGLPYKQFFVPGYEPAEMYGGTSAVALRYIDHDSQDEGAEPLPATLKAEVIGLARDIAANDRDYRVKAAAALLVKALPD